MNQPLSASRPGPEILAPAGSPEALTAAVRCGADAVYLGGGGFNARRNAQNFEGDALRDAIAECHAHGVRVHFALNTLVREEELPSALALAEQVCALGADALILQDLGLARRIRAAAPDMPLHASTQLSCHSPAGVRELAALGFSRVVLAREMSREEIAACVGQGTEIEIFVHGALCMCVSGQCELSAMIGGRSGNRGLCAQPCRLPFKPTDGGLPGERDAALSLRDLSLYPYMKELCALGVHSLKIEGRMKRPEYVAAASACFSAARDYAAGVADTPPDPALLRDLQAVFSRSGFTDGYYTGRRDASMFGVRRREDVTAAAPVLGRLKRLYGRESPRIGVRMSLSVRRGRPAALTAEDPDGNRVTVGGDPPEEAVRRPLDPARAKAQLEKTGGTPFAAAADCRLEEGLTLPLAALNALRREALDTLLRQRSAPRPVPFHPDVRPDTPALSGWPPLRREEGPKLVARFARAEQVPDAPDADLLVLPLDTPDEALRRLCGQAPVAVELPRGMFGAETDVRRRLDSAVSAGIRAVCVNQIGGFAPARQTGLPVIAGFGLNVANRAALDTLAERGAGGCLLSQELTFPQMRFALDAPLPVGILAYGRQPLMLMRCCPLRATIGCRACGGNGSLTDRKGMVFPVACTDGCAELFNSAPLYLADRLDRLPPLDFLTAYFTDETPERAASILDQYRNGGTPPPVFTRGLYKRGVD